MSTTTLSRFAALAEQHPDLGIDVESFDRLEGQDNVNTKVCYIYRDCNNFKQCGEAIFAGKITAQQLEALLGYCDEDGGFIPGQVGMTDLQPLMTGGYDPDMDHPFHDFSAFSLTTEEANTAGIDEFDRGSIEDFVARFETVSWDQSHVPC